MGSPCGRAVSHDAPVTDDDTDGIRPLRPEEYRAAFDLFLGSLHVAPVQDTRWADIEPSFEPGRVLGAFRDGTLVGTALSFTSELAVPGGARLPMGMVTRVGVRPDHTRRGVLTGLMRAQLTGMTEPLATLRASEALIYGRFGYGVATRGRTMVVQRRRAAPHSSVADTGRIRLVPLADAVPVVTALYDGIGPQRPGWSARPEGWWRSAATQPAAGRSPALVAVHSGPDGEDGFAVYDVAIDFEDETKQTTLHVHDLTAETPEVWAALWHFLLTVDLVEEVSAWLRPVDEPLELLYADRRAVRTTRVDDETWLRLVDVPAALAARSYRELTSDAGSVVIEVRDPFLPANSGRYLIGDGAARRVGEPAELSMDVAALAMLYLGDVAASTLAATGRLTAMKADAPRVADRLFGVPESPWCGTFF
jgi:predicted acetyltransferase